MGDGWQPVWLSSDEIESELNYLKNIAREVGREPSTLVLSLRNRLRLIGADEKQTKKIEVKEHPFLFQGTSEEIAGYIQRFKEIGVSHIVLDVLARSDKEMLDMVEKFSHEIMPAFKN